MICLAQGTIKSLLKVWKLQCWNSMDLLLFCLFLWINLPFRLQQQRLKQLIIGGTTGQPCWNCQRSRRTCRPKRIWSKVCRVNHRNYSMYICLVKEYDDYLPYKTRIVLQYLWKINVLPLTYSIIVCFILQGSRWAACSWSCQVSGGARWGPFTAADPPETAGWGAGQAATH